MKAVILAGGLGTRLSEETSIRPKPMVEIGGQPILWHILKMYSQQGIHDFIVCLGYKGYIIKEYFANYFLHTSDVTFDIAHNKMTVHNSITEPWNVTLVDTGEDTGTGGRLRRVAKYLEGEDPFCMTYGDGLADVDIQATIAFHHAHGKLVTLTSVQSVARFGALGLKNNQVYAFQEQPKDEGGWINGGFFVFSPRSLPRSKTTTGCLSASPSKPWSLTARCRPTSTMASGRPWTPCATNSSSKSSGPQSCPMKVLVIARSNLAAIPTKYRA